MKIDLFMLIVILVISLIIIKVFSYKAKSEVKLLILIVGLTTCIYSGLGISFESTSNRFLFYYFFFLICILASIRFSSSSRIVFGKFGRRSNSNNTYKQIDYYLDIGEKIIRILAIVFLMSSFIPLIYPNFRLMDMFNFSDFSSIGIHARRLEQNSNIIIKLCDNAATISMPFFLIYLYNLVEKKKGNLGIVLIVLWDLLEFAQLNYLGRYQIIVMFTFLFIYIIIIKKGEFRLTLGMTMPLIGVALICLPLLVAFMDLRLGRATEEITILESIKVLFESECSYPKYYELCMNNAGIISGLSFLLWMICLPIPSIIWPSKPAVHVSTVFTGLALGKTSVTAAGYYNVLPSILGESIMIFGKEGFFLEAILVGTLIGLYFRIFLKSKKLTVLTAYMTILTATIGRGGVQSYIPTLISGTIFLLLFIVIEKQVIKRKYS